MKVVKSQTGMTLLEVMLVLAIATSLILLSVRMFQTYKTEQAFDDLQYNVDLLLQALGSYYQANCSTNSAYYTPPLTKQVVTIATLQAGGYLPATFNIASAYNPLVDNTVALNTAYKLQLNPLPLTQVNMNCNNYTRILVNGSATPTTICTQTPTPITAGPATIIWQVQVAIKLANSANQQAYAQRMSANCVSNWSGVTVPPCSTSPTAGGYLVWERLPSFTSTGITSVLWPSMHMLKSFSDQYTHDRLYEFQTNGQYINQQYYQCGG